MSKKPTNYLAVWAWLLTLLAVSVLTAYLPFGQTEKIALMFLVATVKAVLIGTYFMHLKVESQFVRAIAIVPVVIFVIMTVALVPDTVWNR